MIIIGHHLIQFEPLFFIKESEDIKNTPSNSVVIFEFDSKTIPLCRYCNENAVDFALIADSYHDLILSSTFDPKYIVCDKALSPKAQKFADDYVLDSKVLYYSSDESDLEWVAENAIDGILFEEGISYEAVS